MRKCWLPVHSIASFIDQLMRGCLLLWGLTLIDYDRLGTPVVLHKGAMAGDAYKDWQFWRFKAYLLDTGSHLLWVYTYQKIQWKCKREVSGEVITAHHLQHRWYTRNTVQRSGMAWDDWQDILMFSKAYYHDTTPITTCKKSLSPGLCFYISRFSSLYSSHLSKEMIPESAFLVDFWSCCTWAQTQQKKWYSSSEVETRQTLLHRSLGKRRYTKVPWMVTSCHTVLHCHEGLEIRSKKTYRNDQLRVCSLIWWICADVFVSFCLNQMAMEISVCLASGRSCMLQTNATSTVGSLKREVQEWLAASSSKVASWYWMTNNSPEKKEATFPLKKSCDLNPQELIKNPHPDCEVLPTKSPFLSYKSRI